MYVESGSTYKEYFYIKTGKKQWDILVFNSGNTQSIQII